MQFSNRERIIISYLKRNDYVSAEELANYLGVSERTIKSDVANLKSILNKHENIFFSIPGKGYHLNHDVNFDSNTEISFNDKDLILSNSDRLSYIIQRLLCLNQAIKYEDLADELFISVSSLKRDMQKIRALLLEYNLKVNYAPNQGVWITGNEFDFRQAISYYFYQSFWSYLSTYDQEVYVRDEREIKEIERIIDDTLEKYQIAVDENARFDLAILIKVCSLRSQFDNKLYLNQNDYTSKDFEAISEIVRYTNSQINTQVTTKAIDYLALQLNSKKILNETSEDINFLTELVLEIQQEIYRNFNLDFSNFTDLWEKVKLHIKQLLLRLERNVIVYNPLVFKLSRDYLFASKISISTVAIIEKYSNYKHISIDEYGYFILYFQSMIEQLSTVKEILIYTGNNRALENFVNSLMMQYYPKSKLHWQFVNHLPNETVRFDGLITFVNSKKKMSKQIVITENIRENIRKLPTLLATVGNNKMVISRYIKDESILISNSRKKVNIIKEIINHLDKFGYLKQNREYKFIFQEVGNGAVHIQDLYKVLQYPICMVIVLKHPILWEKTVIKTLFLIKTKKDGDPDLNVLCNTFSKFINNPDKIKLMHDSPDVSTLLNILI